MRVFVPVLLLLPLLAGCTCDPPVERLASHKTRVAKRTAEATGTTSPTAVNLARQPSPRSVVKTIRVKSCDCPEDFDPQVCGDRRAYTWSRTCPSQMAKPVLKVPSSLKGSEQP